MKDLLVPIKMEKADYLVKLTKEELEYNLSLLSSQKSKLSSESDRLTSLIIGIKEELLRRKQQDVEFISYDD